MCSALLLEQIVCVCHIVARRTLFPSSSPPSLLRSVRGGRALGADEAREQNTTTGPPGGRAAGAVVSARGGLTLVGCCHATMIVRHWWRPAHEGGAAPEGHHKLPSCRHGVISNDARVCDE